MTQLNPLRRAALALGLLVAAALVFPVIALSWNIETVDSTGELGWDTSLALDPSTGHPRISYFDRTNDDLKYAAWDGAAWAIETVDSAGDVGWHTSLALDPSTGHPRISYTDWNYDLWYAAWNGVSWDIETVDGANRANGTSLALDPTTGHPRISYRGENDVVKYAAWGGASWAVETVDSYSRVGWPPSLALDPTTGHPRIGYVRIAVLIDGSTYDHVMYAAWDGASWALETIDSDGNFLSDPSLALDPVTGAPRISYVIHYPDEEEDNPDYANLKYAAWDGASWAVETVDNSADSVGWHTSLALDRCGNPRISYIDITNKGLKYAASGDCSPEPDEYEPSDTPSTAADLSDWQHIDWICLDELRGQFPPTGREDQCPGVFDDGAVPAAAVDFWYMEINDLTIDSVTDADFYHIDLPDYTDAAQGGHPDIDPDPTVIEPLFECGTTQRREFVPGGVDSTINIGVRGRLFVEIIPEINRLAPAPVAVDDERVGLYRNDGAGWFRDDAMGWPHSRALMKQIDCPQEGIDLRELVFSFGERNEPRPSVYRTGGYRINLGYQITAERIIPDTSNVFPGVIGPLPCLSGSFWPGAGFSFFPRCGNGNGPRFNLWGVHPVDPPNFLACLADGPNCLELFSFTWPETNTALNAEIVAPTFMQFSLLDANLIVIAEALPSHEQPLRGSKQDQPVTFLLEAGELPAGRYYLQVAGAPSEYIVNFAPPLTYDSANALFLPAIAR